MKRRREKKPCRVSSFQGIVFHFQTFFSFSLLNWTYSKIQHNDRLSRSLFFPMELMRFSIAIDWVYFFVIARFNPMENKTKQKITERTWRRLLLLWCSCILGGETGSYDTRSTQYSSWYTVWRNFAPFCFPNLNHSIPFEMDILLPQYWH